jgi:hypothetical protein
LEGEGYPEKAKAWEKDVFLREVEAAAVGGREGGREGRRE